MNSIEAKYRARTPRSEALQRRAELVMPGGETRSGSFHAPYSVTMDHAAGCRSWDVDGNEYIDVVNNFTCLVHGHAYPPIIEAAQEAVRKGTTWTAKAVDQINLAELIVDRVKSIDMVRYANSGSEGVFAALAVARAYNQRTKLLVARYSYHGHFLETSVVSQFPAGAGQAGISNGWVGTYVADFGDAAAFEQILAEHGDEIAAVMLEPYMAFAGMVSAPPEFFQRVHAAARKAGALFILDEATVFRLDIGGAQARLGIEPDVTVLGKIVAGGFPGGGIGGKREFMELLDPRGTRLHLSGTFTGNPVTMAAGLACMRHLTAEKIARQEQMMETIETRLHAMAAKHGLPFSTRRVGSMMQMYFSPTAPSASPLRQDEETATLFQLACMANGVFMVVRATMNVSTVMTDADVDEVCERFDRAVADVAGEI